MSTLNLYQSSLTLLTDLYQLTMAYGYWKSGTKDKETVFNLFFRKHPFQSGFTIFCGLSQAVEFIKRFRFDDSDLAYLEGLNGADGKALFEKGFLDELSALRLICDIDAVAEGTLVFPHEPLIRVRGPIMQCQLLETALLNMVNFQTLIATKAARVVSAAHWEPVLEFGLRRAQGIDGSLSASWAAYVGGCAGTSNVLAGKLFGIPVRGTHAHSWIMSFDDEPSAFEAYAQAMPNNCVFLVDTYDTLQGVRNAVEVGLRLRERGHEMLGIRLDSGDLAALSIEARKILDEGGFSNAQIVASNDLDEHAIAELKRNGARIGIWGVGTRLVTAYDQPALGGVYKLTASRQDNGTWQPRLKLSEEQIKTSNPGIQQVRRFRRGDRYIADAIYEETLGLADSITLIGLDNPDQTLNIPGDADYIDLLEPVFRAGKCVRDPVSIERVRAHARAQYETFHHRTEVLGVPSHYPVGLDQRLYRLKEDLIRKASGAQVSRTTAYSNRT